MTKNLAEEDASHAQSSYRALRYQEKASRLAGDEYRALSLQIMSSKNFVGLLRLKCRSLIPWP
jgi:hypothetical protein